MQIEDFEIRQIQIEQVEMLLEMAKSTFVTYFENTTSRENLERYVEKSFTIDKIKSELENQSSQFYFAKYQKQNVGYLKVNFAGAQTELQDFRSLEIERIYVIEDFIGKNAAQTLFLKALEIAKFNQLLYIWLGVWEYNKRAMRFYEKLGFKVFSNHIFMMGSEPQTDLLMKLEL